MYICNWKENKDMSNKVIATIDVSRPAGRKIVRELQKKRTVTLEYPLPEGVEDMPTHEEVFSKLLDDLSEDYAFDMKKQFKF
jgi:adenine C2-methylase RlmN of 23S rRNA A2503 and tRNA A37